jgi:hypothetical protein
VTFLQIPSWLEELIQEPEWRSAVYQLSEQHINCLMLQFAIQVSLFVLSLSLSLSLYLYLCVCVC